MISETSVEISDLFWRWQVELEARHARRNKIRQIDRLLNQLELVNLADSQRMPADLRRQVIDFISESEHYLAGKSAGELSVSESMEALYEIQDTLLLGSTEEEEEP
jgi:hypothetical protein